MRTILILFTLLIALGAWIALMAVPPSVSGKQFSVHMGRGGWWWARIEGHAYPFGAWRMDRGPYPFRWMAELEFPIERLTKDGPRR